MRFITISAAILLGSALNAANAQQLGASSPTPSKTPVLQKGFTSGGPGASFVSGGSDTCATATAIAGPGTFPGDTLGATTDGPAFSCATGGQDVWYNWTALATGSTTVSFCAANGGSSTYDTLIAVYDTTGCTGTQLSCNDDFCGLQSQLTFAATAATTYKIRVGGFSANSGSYVMGIVAAPAGPPNDSCATPTVYVSGVAPWTNVSAITDGGAESCGTPQQDVWFSWVATCTGQATFTLCPGGELNPDTVIAAYSGAACPTPGSAIGCDDDTCSAPAFGTSRTTFNVASGNTYLLRIGGFGGTTGSGNFEVTCFVPPPAGPCDVFDDGTTENSVGTNNPAHDILWMHSQGEIGLSTIVNSISTAWGSLGFAGGPPNGTPARVGIWTDPNNDGNPNDAVFIAASLTNTVVAGTNTNAKQLITLASPISVSDKYFIGASCTGGTFAAPLDQSSGPGGGRVWIVGSTVGPIDYTNLSGEEIPPTNEDTIAPGFWLLEGDCKDAIETFCEGDTGCPCSNDNDGSNDPAGCANSVFASGARLSASGDASLSADTLVLDVTSQKPSTLTLFWQGNVDFAPVLNGDGLRCVNGLRRMYNRRNANSSAVSAPPGNDPGEGVSVSQRSSDLGDPLLAGSKRSYYATYRDNHPTHGCAAETINNTNAIRVTWLP